MSTPKLCWVDPVKFEFEGHFGGQKAQKRKIAKKTINRFLSFLAKLLVTGGSNLAQDLFSLGSTTLFYKGKKTPGTVSKSTRQKKYGHNHLPATKVQKYQR